MLFFSYSILYAGPIVELHTCFPPTPQHTSVPHCHIPAAQYRVRPGLTRTHTSYNFPKNVTLCFIHSQATNDLVFLRTHPSPRSEALFPPVLSWLMFVWINIEQEAMLAHNALGRQEVDPSSALS